MLKDYKFSTSFLLYSFQGLLLLTIISSLFINYKTFLALSFFEKVNLMSVLATAIGAHGLYHFSLEHLKTKN